MPEAPPARRRWLQFRLSTLLILTAIVAWGMSCWPFVAPNGEYRQFTEHGLIGWGEARPLFGLRLGWRRSADDPTKEEELGINPRIQLPALALAAFVEWKIAMAVAGYRARKGNTPAGHS